MSTPTITSGFPATTGGIPNSDDGHGAPPVESNIHESLGAELLRRAKESQPALEAAWDSLMAQWGVQGELVGIERLREMSKEDSARKPPATLFSSELIAAREESRS